MVSGMWNGIWLFSLLERLHRSLTSRALSAPYFSKFKESSSTQYRQPFLHNPLLSSVESLCRTRILTLCVKLSKLSIVWLRRTIINIIPMTRILRQSGGCRFFTEVPMRLQLPRWKCIKPRQIRYTGHTWLSIKHMFRLKYTTHRRFPKLSYTEI